MFSANIRITGKTTRPSQLSGQRGFMKAFATECRPQGCGRYGGPFARREVLSHDRPARTPGRPHDLSD